ncbi:hypothetical protein Ancab_028883 [Ancistrocladus abbreviatus]
MYCLWSIYSVMDGDHIIAAPEAEEGDQNGVHSEHLSQGEGVDALKVVSGILNSAAEGLDPNVSLETLDGKNNSGIMEASTSDVVGNSNRHDTGYGLTASEEVESKELMQSKNCKPQTGQFKSKGEKPSSSKNAAAALIKKTNLGKDLPAKSETASSTHNVVQSDYNTEKPKLKALRKDPPNKTEGESDSTSSPAARDAKPHRVGKLPSYSFSFRCGERAERRREFYTKLEEKIYAKEVEKSDQQAKSKVETQEAEIKMLQKSLTFKATPMPSFYQEPAPPKVELKKFGRKKNSSTSDADAEEDSRCNDDCTVSCLSCDEQLVGCEVPSVSALTSHGTVQVECGNVDGQHGYLVSKYSSNGQCTTSFYPFSGVTDELKAFIHDILENSLKKAVKAAREKTEAAVSNGKGFCISCVDVGLDATAVREAVLKAIQQKVPHHFGFPSGVIHFAFNSNILIFNVDDETTNKAVVYAGVPDKGNTSQVDSSANAFIWE